MTPLKPPVKRAFYLAGFVLLACPVPLMGQDRPLDVSGLGFKIPPGIVKQPSGQGVLTNDEAGKPAVAEVQVFVGQHRIVLLPDGKLVARDPQNSPFTDRPFKPLSAEQMTTRLAEEFAGFKIRKTRHYVYVFNTSPQFAYTSSRILESMLPGINNYAKQQRIATHEPKIPLVVIMFRTKAQFQKYRKMRDGIVAYYHTLTNRVVMYEEAALVNVRPQLAIQQKISTIAHEGVHQILHNIGVQKRLSSWPMWLTEGMAEYFAPTSTGRRLKWKGAGQVNDLRMFELENYLKVTDRPSDGKVIRDAVVARRLTSTGYAVSWSLTHFLAKTRRADFNRYVHEVAKLRPLEGGRGAVGNQMPKNLVLFRKHFGDDLAKLEAGLMKHLRKQPYTEPFADRPHYVAKMAVPNGRKPQREAKVFHSTQLAEQWLGEAVKRIPEARRAAARTEIRQFANRSVAETAARVWLRTGK